MIGKEGEQWQATARGSRGALVAFAVACSFSGMACAQASEPEQRARRVEYIEVRRLVDVVYEHPMLAESDDDTEKAGREKAWPSAACWLQLQKLRTLQRELGVALDGFYRLQRGLDVSPPEPIEARVRYETEVLRLLSLVQERALNQQDGPAWLEGWLKPLAENPESWEGFGLSDWPVRSRTLAGLAVDEVKRRGRVQDRLDALGTVMARVETDVMRAFESNRLRELDQRIQSLAAELESLGARTGPRLDTRQQLEQRRVKMASLVEQAMTYAADAEAVVPGSAYSTEDPYARRLSPEFKVWKRQFLRQNPCLQRWAAEALSKLTNHAGAARAHYENVQAMPANRRFGGDVKAASQSKKEFADEAEVVRRDLNGIKQRFGEFQNETLEDLINRKLGNVPETLFAKEWPASARLRWVKKWGKNHGTPEQMRLATLHTDENTDDSWRLNGRSTAMVLVDTGEQAFLIDRHEMTVREFCERLAWLESHDVSMPRALHRWWTANKAAVHAMPEKQLVAGVPFEVAAEFARYAYRSDDSAGYELTVPTIDQLRAAFDEVADFETDSGQVGGEDAANLERPSFFAPPCVRPGRVRIWGLDSGLAELCGPEQFGRVHVMGLSDYRPWTELPGGADEWERPGADHSVFFSDTRERPAHLGAPAIGFRLVYTLRRVR